MLLAVNEKLISPCRPCQAPRHLCGITNLLKRCNLALFMARLDNLLIIGIRDNSEIDPDGAEKGMTHYYANIWSSRCPSVSTVVPVPYRGGYIGGFNHITALDRYLIIADGEGILAYDLSDPSKGYAELTEAHEVSEHMCKTSNYLASCLDNLIHVRSLDRIIAPLKQSNFSNTQIDIPFRQIQHMDKGDTALSMIPIPNTHDELVLLNNADDRTYMINPKTLESMAVQIQSKQQFPHTFQRREQYHFLRTDESQHLIFTESTSDDKHPNRVYSFDIRGPPTITELEPLELPGRQILSMLPSKKDRLTLLINYSDHSHLETLDPSNRRILNSKPLSRRYDLGDRLQQVGDDLLIVRHLENKIVDAKSEQSITLTGAENDVPIPEISSTWSVPQYLFVAHWPNTEVLE